MTTHAEKLLALETADDLIGSYQIMAQSIQTNVPTQESVTERDARIRQMEEYLNMVDRLRVVRSVVDEALRSRSRRKRPLAARERAAIDAGHQPPRS